MEKKTAESGVIRRTIGVGLNEFEVSMPFQLITGELQNLVESVGKVTAVVNAVDRALVDYNGIKSIDELSTTAIDLSTKLISFVGEGKTSFSFEVEIGFVLKAKFIFEDGSSWTSLDAVKTDESGFIVLMERGTEKLWLEDYVFSSGHIEFSN